MHPALEKVIGPPQMTEEALRAQVVEGLRWKGYTVLSTQHHACRGDKRMGTGTDLGIPDLLVTRKGWGNLWKTIELKRPGGGRATPEQQVLIDAGHTRIARSLEECLAILEGEQ